MNDYPEKIYLQREDLDASFRESAEVTWCADQVHDADVMYIRADIADGHYLEKLRWILSASPEDLEQWRCGEEAARYVNGKPRWPDTAQMPEQCQMLGY